MRKPLFSIVAIAKNEANTLPKLLSSLEEYKSLGGNVYLLDTGSTDKTVEIAKAWGCIVHEVGEKFITKIDKFTANSINRKYIIGKEPDILEEGNRFFNFAAARNHISLLAETDFIVTLDCDEAYSRFDIEALNKLIEEGVEQFEYQFVYAHDPSGRPAVKFVQSKAYDRRKVEWKGIVHEVLQHKPGAGTVNIKYVGEETILLEHYQEQGKEHRGNYLTGLALDCYQNPLKDRQSHYFARELMYTYRYKSAIKEFQRHVAMQNAWVAEQAQSLTFMGDCFGKLNMPEAQIEHYNKAYFLDSNRREPLIKAAEFMLHNKNYKAAAVYSAGALQLPWADYYANDKRHYEDIPHFILYVSRGWLGDIEGAKYHLQKALEYAPYHPDYLRDTQFYFEYPDNGIQGWMRFPELQFLYNEAKKHRTIVEVGSFKGKSTHALLKGCKNGTVTAVDTWLGSDDEQDLTNKLSKAEDVFEAFKENTKNFENSRKTIHAKSIDASTHFQNEALDMVFIDANHLYPEVKNDILAWLPKVKHGGVLCGHDFDRVLWPGVVQAVEELLGEVELHDSIWVYRKGEGKIPKRIFTIWLNEKEELPELVQKCITSHEIAGYEHKIITLKNCFKENKYLQECLSSTDEKTKWVKMADYLRLHYLHEEGGIYLDADVQVLFGTNFDYYLNHEMFLGLEQVSEGGHKIVIGNAVIGARKKHPFIGHLLNKMNAKFSGIDGDCYSSGMDLLNVEGVNFQDKFALLSKDVFYPEEGQLTSKTICFHHFMNSWVSEENSKYSCPTIPGGVPPVIIKESNTVVVPEKEILPTVSFIIPQLGRDEGLKKCIDSIHSLKYPQELIDIQIIEGQETVPEKVKKGVLKSSSEIICYAANDTIFTEESLLRAVRHSGQFSLIAFNTGEVYEDKGNICEHFIIRRDFLPKLEDGLIFHTDFHHCGVDNFLWAQAEKLGQAHRCDEAEVIHNHFAKHGGFDKIYAKGWHKIEEDRKVLHERLEKLKKSPYISHLETN